MEEQEASPKPSAKVRKDHVGQVEKYRRRCSKLMARVGQLEAELSVERGLRKALEHMKFAEDQEPERLRELKRKYTMKNKMKP